jgi:hypothetical protein
MRKTIAAALIAGALTLTGCGAAAVETSPTRTASSTPTPAVLTVPDALAAVHAARTYEDERAGIVALRTSMSVYCPTLKDFQQAALDEAYAKDSARFAGKSGRLLGLDYVDAVAGKGNYAFWAGELYAQEGVCG